MKQILLFSMLVFVTLLKAQQSAWNSKLIVKHHTGLTDTVWFGLDTAGAEGFQPQLDSLNTDLVHPITFLAQDELVRQQYGTPFCGNLKRDYKAFKTGMIEFDFYLKSDSFPPHSTPNHVELYWDTADFAFSSPNFEIKVVRIISFGGYIYAIDKNDWFVYYNTMPFVEDTNVALIYEQTPWECSSNDKIMGIRMEVWINTYVGIKEKNKSNLFSIYPNPASGNFTIEFTEKLTGLVSVMDITGKIIYSENINNSLITDIFLTASPGLYFLQVYSDDKAYLTTEKIIVI